MGSLTLVIYLYDNPERDSITTLFRPVSDVGLGYTPAPLPFLEVAARLSIPNCSCQVESAHA
jgi:hypothetical protein